MCGIIGYIGFAPAFKYGYQGILRLLNRGYDSVGITTINENVSFIPLRILNDASASLNAQSDRNFDTDKNASNSQSSGILTDDELFVDNLKVQSFTTHKFAGDRAIDRILDNRDFHTGSVSILHSRWRTIGDKSDANSHPHHDFYDKFALVHNGIVENYAELRDELYYTHGYKFRSETDTEVIVNLISYYYMSEGTCVVAAITKALARIRGTYALAILCIDTPETLYCVRHGSPLLIGMSEDSSTTMISSECAGFDAQIVKYFPIEMNDIISISKCGDGTIAMKSNGLIQYESQTKSFTGETLATSPAPFAHWTIKEIYDQVDVARSAIANGGRLCMGTNAIKLGGLDRMRDELLSCDNIILLGCGTSFNACQLTAHLFKSIKCFNTVQVHDGAEFSEDDIPFHGRSKTCFVFVSQSGETKDLHRCLETVKSSCESRHIHYHTMGVINVVDSMIAREVECGVYLNCGREVAVASTKAFTSQIIVLTLIALWFSQARPRPLLEKDIHIQKILGLPDEISKAIEVNTKMCQKIAKKLKDKSSIFLLGRGTLFSVAREGALKLKEIGYIHAEGYSSAALKHGPYALLTPGFPVILLMEKQTASKTIYDELKARDATVITIGTIGTIAPLDDFNIKLSETGHTEVLATIMLQLIAYYLSIEKGINPDYPRNIAKVLSTD
jgi:glucosamine--fructose-6-phosphate aminotransferase (isomerizing)